MPIQILDVEVIPWGDDVQDRWAVAIRYSNGRRQLIELGNRFQAEKEANRLRREEIKSSLLGGFETNGGHFRLTHALRAFYPRAISYAGRGSMLLGRDQTWAVVFILALLALIFAGALLIGMWLR